MALGMLGKYERLDILGHGASGIVYLAQDTLLRRQVALKEITAHGDEMRKVLEEARVLDRLRHPNIVAVHGVDTINGKVVIDMEYVQGSNLLEIMRHTDGPLSQSDSLQIAVQICDGLAFAHGQRTVHRDIKPANILVSNDHRVKLADFGLAQVLGTNSYAGGAGTFAYMAPEDFDQNDKSDQQSDLWAVGVILYEMLTGRRPFTVVNARDPFAWSRAVSNDDVPAPSTYVPLIPPLVDRICLKALQRSKADRYQSAAQIAADLRAVLSDLPSEEKLFADGLPTAGDVAADAEPLSLIGATDIDTLLAEAPSRWDEICQQLSSGNLARWLGSIGEPLLASVALELSRNLATPIGNRMRDFLYRAGVDLDRAAADDARRGGELLASGQSAEAVEFLQRAVNLDPGQPAYFRQLAQAGRSAGDLDLVRETLSCGLRLHPHDRFMKREIIRLGGAAPVLSTSYVNFGQLRHGEVRTVHVNLKAAGTELLKGRVASAPGWLRVTPLSFGGRQRYNLKLMADTLTLPRDQEEYEDKVLLETSGGTVELQVSLLLLPKRPTFASIFFWYLPVLAFCVLPCIVGQLVTVTTYLHGGGVPLAPAGLIDSGILFSSFLAVNVISDTRWIERTGAGVGILLLPIGIVYLFVLLQSAPHSMMLAWPKLIETCLLCLTIPVVQVVTLIKARQTFSQWPIWCAAIVAVSAAVSFLLWHAGANGVQ